MGHNSSCFVQGHENFDDPFKRRLIESLARNMTICIAAIADKKLTKPVIVFCADRLISGGIEFNKGSPKIHPITSNCVLMYSSENTLVSDLIIKEITDKFSMLDHKPIKEIIDFIAKKCEEQFYKKLEKDVLTKYNFISEKLGVDSNEYALDAKNEVNSYRYPRFEFLICGFDSINEPHIYKVDEKGNFQLYDSFGFAATGSGEGLAHSEMTKWYYSPYHPLSLVIPRVYFAKKISERIGGVGTLTDFYFLAYKETGDGSKCVLFDLNSDEKLLNDLNTALKNIRDSEINEINKMANLINDIFKANADNDNKSIS